MTESFEVQEQAKFHIWIILYGLFEEVKINTTGEGSFKNRVAGQIKKKRSTQPTTNPLVK